MMYVKTQKSFEALVSEMETTRQSMILTFIPTDDMPYIYREKQRTDDNLTDKEKLLQNMRSNSNLKPFGPRQVFPAGRYSLSVLRTFHRGTGMMLSNAMIERPRF